MHTSFASLQAVAGAVVTVFCSCLLCRLRLLRIAMADYSDVERERLPRRSIFWWKDKMRLTLRFVDQTPTAESTPIDNCPQTGVATSKRLCFLRETKTKDFGGKSAERRMPICRDTCLLSIACQSRVSLERTTLTLQGTTLRGQWSLSDEK